MAQKWKISGIFTLAKSMQTKPNKLILPVNEYGRVSSSRTTSQSALFSPSTVLVV